VPVTARETFAEAQRMHASGDITGAIDMARRALELDPILVDALEYLATALITRRRRYAEGLELIERALAAESGDAGLWYAAGWNYEFAAHEIERRRSDPVLDPRSLYERAAEAFRRCLALKPEGKLVGDAEDLLDHVENKLASM
jgi:tetratricopeptide (TPR) repeat protein